MTEETVYEEEYEEEERLASKLVFALSKIFGIRSKREYSKVTVRRFLTPIFWSLVLLADLVVLYGMRLTPARNTVWWITVSMFLLVVYYATHEIVAGVIYIIHDLKFEAQVKKTALEKKDQELKKMWSGLVAKKEKKSNKVKTPRGLQKVYRNLGIHLASPAVSDKELKQHFDNAVKGVKTKDLYIAYLLEKTSHNLALHTPNVQEIEIRNVIKLLFEELFVAFPNVEDQYYDEYLWRNYEWDTKALEDPVDEHKRGKSPDLTVVFGDKQTGEKFAVVIWVQNNAEKVSETTRQINAYVKELRKKEPGYKNIYRVVVPVRGPSEKVKQHAEKLHL